MERTGVGQRELSRRSGRNISTISFTLQGKTWGDKYPPLDDIEAYARALGVGVEELTGEVTPAPVVEDRAAHDEETTAYAELGKQIMSIVNQRRNIERGPQVRILDIQQVPVVNGLSASELASDVRQVAEWIAVSSAQLNGAQDPVAYIINGDCLWERWGIKTGDTLIVDAANREPRDGQIVAARINDQEETAKEFHRVPEGIDLRPTSPGYDAIPIRGTDQLTIIGVYVTHLVTGKR